MELAPDEFERLARPEVVPAYRLAMAMLRSRQDAEDVVQDAVLAAWRKIGQLRDREGFRPWFLTIVANRCRMALRSRWWSVVRLAEIVRPGARDPDDGIVARLDLQRALARLSPTDRAALVLFYALDLPLEEVATTLRLSPSAAKSRIHRALTRIRTTLAVEVTV
jgi:RNA polymerase sigma-70 factor, ECF subfamily